MTKRQKTPKAPSQPRLKKPRRSLGERLVGSRRILPRISLMLLVMGVVLSLVSVGHGASLLMSNGDYTVYGVRIAVVVFGVVMTAKFYRANRDRGKEDASAMELVSIFLGCAIVLGAITASYWMKLLWQFSLYDGIIMSVVGVVVLYSMAVYKPVAAASSSPAGDQRDQPSTQRLSPPPSPAARPQGTAHAVPTGRPTTILGGGMPTQLPSPSSLKEELFRTS